MANAHRAEATLEVPREIDGEVTTKTYRLKFSWNAAAEFETVTGKAVSDALQEIAAERYSATSARAMLWAGLQTHHPEVTLRDAGGMIDQLGWDPVWKVLGGALKYYFPPPPDSPPDPPPPAV